MLSNLHHLHTLPATLCCILLFSFWTYSVQASTVQIQIEEYQPAESQQNNNNNNYLLKLRVNNEPEVKLNMTINHFLRSDVEVLLGRATNNISYLSTFEPWKLPSNQTNDFTAYQDKTYGAAFLKFPDSRIQGTFRYGSKEYFIQPDSAKRRRRRKRSVTVYTAKEVKQSTLTAPPDTRIKGSIEYSTNLTNFLTVTTNQRMYYTAEIVMLIDYSIFKNWYDLTDKTLRSEERERQAVNQIRYYYANIANSMDLRYANIKERDYSVSIKLNGLVIATSYQLAPWSTNYLLNIGGKLALDTYKALDNIPLWLNVNANKLPPFDNLLVITDNTLYAGNYNNGEPRFISGLANIRAICSNQAISISQENGEFATTGTAAHELAHNLGSYHDDVTVNSCNSKDQYIMSVAPGQLTPQTFMHPFFFSACSIDYMRQYLASEAVSQRNCLLQLASYVPAQPGSSIPTNMPLGQQIKINVQCQLIFGPGSYYCAGMSNDETMCSSLFCFDPMAYRCSTSSEMRAYVGTTCGNRKWCKQGSCVYDPYAPVASDVCLSGDTRDPATKCWELMARDFSKCYDSNYYKKCCATCEYFKKKSNWEASCMYGDLQPDYCKTLKPYACYDPSNVKSCCQTCKNLKMTNLPNCEYGDRADWCGNPSIMKTSQCYSSENICCLFCARNNLKLSGCQYGDRVDWCNNITPDQCRIASGECCLKCNQQYLSMVPSILRGINVQVFTPPTPQKRFPNCNDGRPWCDNLAPFSCYDVTVRNSCPCVCQQMQVSYSNGYEYGDKRLWCNNLSKSDCDHLFSSEDCNPHCSAGMAEACSHLNASIWKLALSLVLIFNVHVLC